MEFREFWEGLTAGKKRAFARDVGRHPDYLRQVAGGHVRAGPLLAIDIEGASNGKVKRSDMRPDLFAVL